MRRSTIYSISALMIHETDYCEEALGNFNFVISISTLISIWEIRLPEKRAESCHVRKERLQKQRLQLFIFFSYAILLNKLL